MITIKERYKLLHDIIDDLSMTTSMNAKRDIVTHINSELREDFDYIANILAGNIKFGFKMEDYIWFYNYTTFGRFNTFKEVLDYLLQPRLTGDLSRMNISAHVANVPYPEFLARIIDRDFKIGVGNSIVDKSGYEPMLAKKFESAVRQDGYGYFITEKLDGNRCIAYYDFVDCKWKFLSRTGKQMYVDFDLSSFPTDYVYDGEVMARDYVGFNATTGMINSHTITDKLVYNIFDIQLDIPYADRRHLLDSINIGNTSKDVRILPLLFRTNSREALYEFVPDMLDSITSKGGEGLMINYGGATYTHKRTDALLKVKKVYTMDMRVESVEYGKNKYEGLIGSLCCAARIDGKSYYCEVGSGLSDEQRLNWALRPDDIIGKYVEVAYFSTSQNTDTFGTNTFSLRFPRLKKVRHDKSEESID